MASEVIKWDMPDTVFPPGETLKENIEHLGISQRELAKRMKRPLKTINEIIKGKTSLTPETAAQLEVVLDVPAHIWLNLETMYQSCKAKKALMEKTKKEVGLANKYPYKEMVKLDWIQAWGNLAGYANELQRYFGVTSLTQVQAVEAKAFLRASVKRQPDPYAVAAWFRQGELIARDVATSPYDKASFIEALSEVRKMTLDLPHDFALKIQKIFAEVGVVVAYAKYIKNSSVNGATKWITPTKALMVLTLRYPWEDIFWFTLFHEAGHIILHGKKDQFIDYREQFLNKKEHEANDFASEYLVNRDDYEKFMTGGILTGTSIKAFARNVGVCPGVIVGRLQHDKVINHSRFNELRRKFHFDSNTA